MPLELSAAQARQFLERYHFQPMSIDSVFDRLGTVQYDPLNPVGRNIDLVLQARVPGYRIDEWQRYAYEQRCAYDAWDKQACLVPIDQWSMRTTTRTHYHAWHDREILIEEPEAVSATLAELDTRGPLSSLEFTDRSAASNGHAWYGPTRVKRILRALWLRGVIVTHHRHAGRHYYDRAERVIPATHFHAPLPSMDEYHRWIVLQRHRATGILRQTAEAAIWSACGDSSIRRRAMQALVEAGELTPARIEGSAHQFHIPTEALELLNQPEMEPRAIFVAPLDSVLWDRKAVDQIFGFNYVWEVYKREVDRLWGYYVLPVFFRGRFVARFDSRLEGGVWHMMRWWWERDDEADVEILDAIRPAANSFMRYLGANALQVGEQVNPLIKQILRP